ncbi:MAG TPA: hypothetical protein VK970_08115, partial [Candidatus Methylacidiphilales bacterium]|nr:hypothetical protein [Candidatus Methylacidiphilales bacterium]
MHAGYDTNLLMESSHQLRQEIITYILQRTEALVHRFLPGFHIPGFMAGYRTNSYDTADLLYLLLGLRELRIDEVCGEKIVDVMPRLLKRIDGPRTETFYSFRVAEVILSLGGLDALTGLSESEKNNLRTAVDSTHILNPETGELKGWAANYWAVLARCEYNRQRLGLLADSTILDKALANTARILAGNPLGYFDDSSSGDGRYDIYSADVHLFIEPFYHLFDKELIERNLKVHVDLLEAIALENGASFGWGRSIGALSVCLTMELGALSLRRGMAANPARTLNLIRHAFEQYKSFWMKDDLIAAHRDGMTEAYRGVKRLLQMTLDCLSKLVAVAHLLEGVEDPAPMESGSDKGCAVLFPEIDILIPFEQKRNAAVWMFRNRHLTFQLPLISGVNADYAAWLHGPGVFENPVESPLVCGVPRLATVDGEFFSYGLPTSCVKIPNGIQLVFDCWQRTSGQAEAPKASRRVKLQVEGDTVVGSELWSLDTTNIQAVSFQIAEAARPLLLSIEAEHQHDLPSHSQTVVDVEGMPEWRS